MLCQEWILFAELKPWNWLLSLATHIAHTLYSHIWVSFLFLRVKWNKKPSTISKQCKQQQQSLLLWKLWRRLRKCTPIRCTDTLNTHASLHFRFKYTNGQAYLLTLLHNQFIVLLLRRLTITTQNNIGFFETIQLSAQCQKCNVFVLSILIYCDFDWKKFVGSKRRSRENARNKKTARRKRNIDVTENNNNKNERCAYVDTETVHINNAFGLCVAMKPAIEPYQNLSNAYNPIWVIATVMLLITTTTKTFNHATHGHGHILMKTSLRFPVHCAHWTMRQTTTTKAPANWHQI